MMMDIGSVEAFCVALLWNAARSSFISAVVVLELLPLVVEPSVLVLLLVLLFDEVESAKPDIIPGGGGGGAFPDPPIAWAKS